MAVYDRSKIQAFLNAVDTAATKATRGKAFEELACYLFREIPGVTITGRNELNTFATQEIDVACRNEQDPVDMQADLPALETAFSLFSPFSRQSRPGSAPSFGDRLLSRTVVRDRQARRPRALVSFLPKCSALLGRHLLELVMKLEFPLVHHVQEVICLVIHRMPPRDCR